MSGEAPGAPAVSPAVVAALRALPSPVCAFVYDRATLRANAGRVRAALPAGTLLCYAVKANGHPDVVGALADCLDGLEVASGGELAIARTALARTAVAGTAPTRALVVFAGPAKTDAELTAAVAAGAVLHVESVHELRRLAHLVGSSGTPTVAVALRVNRTAEPPAGSHRMTGTASQFGMDEAALPEAVAVAAASPAIQVIGFHLHAVSNNLDATVHAGFVVDAVHWSVQAAGRLGIALRYVNVGGGLGVDYAGGAAFDLDALRVGLTAAARALPPDARLVFEPGRLLAASAGWYAAEVLDVKRSHGRWFAVLRGGTHHFRLPAAWGYSHPFAILPVEHWPYPFPRPQVTGAPVNVVGELCTPRDVLARDAPVQRLRAGDVVVFPDAGAYGWDISHHDFLRHEHPTVVVL
ncbi:MAG TPA: type III PLP-dependent enzyme [Micromonosporaceae bacterium]|nr:type III PLP-dependent enzyme [Micromonosporaceae bacterium]